MAFRAAAPPLGSSRAQHPCPRGFSGVPPYPRSCGSRPFQLSSCLRPFQLSSCLVRAVGAECRSVLWALLSGVRGPGPCVREDHSLLCFQKNLHPSVTDCSEATAGEQSSFGWEGMPRPQNCSARAVFRCYAPGRQQRPVLPQERSILMGRLAASSPPALSSCP